MTAWRWVLFEAFALLMAMVSAAVGAFFDARLWRIALPVALLMLLFMDYVMGS